MPPYYGRDINQLLNFAEGATPENFIGVYSGGPQTVSSPGGLHAGDYVAYNGQIYRWDGGRWLDAGGIGADIPIYFMNDPFANAEPAEWGKPFPLWGNGRVNSGAVPGLHTHVNQMQLLEVTAFMEINTELEIPLKDANDNPIMDPAIPPCSYMRRNSATTGGPDFVTDPVNTNIRWTDQNTASKAYIGNNASVTYNELENSLWSHVFRIEKTPQPHWVLRISYVQNRLTGSSGAVELTSDPRTVLVSIMGVPGAVTTTQSVTGGSAGVAGHYRVRKVFYPQQTPGSAGQYTYMAKPILLHDQAYVAPGATASIIYLTDTGGSGGTSLLDLTYVPMVRAFGDREWQQNRGTTETNYKASSLGVGCRCDGIWQGHVTGSGSAAQSIQHPDFDEYNSVTRLIRGSTFWYLEIYSYMNTSNVAGININATGSPDAWSRHFSVHTLGRIP